ncbi:MULTISPECIES: metal-sensing transcriptional repressor [Bacillaceae]|uniref:Metal-sensing transcriptional repressor n=1 Tax=Cytobacillus firmus TaxID=1399 RepID=A0AA46PYF5_CYTFI|nr:MULTISPECIES: metal-sensing transcriptional repressor [Bacillaceae]KML42966.1 cytosolic protein [Cytobacillus firmus]MCS0653179.1 metal-sensing transcriptional repressor [Cytobacillus firmus]UYG95575.1 metal-sensing transcriptional repressor [Cytobacillus firmus]WHY32075.1 metal-sensing transcriptional repressor [Cytobacillus firmus]
MDNHHKHRKSIVNRLAKIEGHVRAIKKMTEEGRDCNDLLIQLSAVRSAVDSCGKLILKDHIEGCLIEAVKSGKEEEMLKQLNDSIDKFIK